MIVVSAALPSNLINPESNSTVTNNSSTTVAVQQSQIKKNDTISFKATLELPSYPTSTTQTQPSSIPG
jgi:hypothetical protein